MENLDSVEKGERSVSSGQDSSYCNSVTDGAFKLSHCGEL